MNNFIIAILGLPGSGKTEVVRFFLEDHKWPSVYFGAPTLEEVQRRGLASTEANERIVRDDLRRQHGMAAMAILLLPKIRELVQTGPVLIESLYSWEEYLSLKQEFGDRFRTIAVYASPNTRYGRLAKRKERPLTRHEAQARDYSQIENAHQAGPIAMADYLITNEETLHHLHNQLEGIVKDILSSANKS